MMIIAEYNKKTKEKKMASCLGLYVEEKIIKYAKVTKDSDIIKIDSFGIKFYDRLGDAIKQVVEETYSYRTPISINLSNEVYNYFYIFNLLSKKDMHSYIKTEFESYCAENHLNRNVYDGKYIYSKNLENQDQSRIVYIYDNQTDIAERNSYFKGHRLDILVPMPTTLPNLINAEKGKNSICYAILNKSS